VSLYQDWRDVRNDVILLYVLFKACLVGYVAYDWAMYPVQGSHVLYVLLTKLGPDSPLYVWAVRFWNHGLWR